MLRMIFVIWSKPSLLSIDFSLQNDAVNVPWNENICGSSSRKRSASIGSGLDLLLLFVIRRVSSFKSGMLQRSPLLCWKYNLQRWTWSWPIAMESVVNAHNPPRVTLGRCWCFLSAWNNVFWSIGWIMSRKWFPARARWLAVAPS